MKKPFLLFCTLFLQWIYAESVSPAKTVEVKKSVESSITPNAVKKPPHLKPAPVPSYNMGEEWEAVRQVKGVSTYRLQNDANTIGVFHARSFKRKFKWTKSSALLKKMMDKKKEALALLNITDWSIDNHSWKKKKTELTVEGSYKTPADKSVFFKEVHHFDKGRVFQILITSQDKNFLNTSMAHQFFNKAKTVLSNGV